jgi:hypothetical protein
MPGWVRLSYMPDANLQLRSDNRQTGSNVSHITLGTDCRSFVHHNWMSNPVHPCRSQGK